MTDKVYIYCLIDPITNHVRYIGKADDFKIRYKGHLKNSSLSKPTHKNNWIKSLILKGETPIMDILDIVDYNDWEFWEMHYISLYKSFGFNLTNMTDGGDGGILISKNDPRYYDICKSRGRKGRVSNRKGIKLSDDLREKYRQILKNIKQPPCSDEKKKRIGYTKKERYKLGLYKILSSSNNPSDTKIEQFTKDDIFIKSWDCIIDAANFLKINADAISKCCRSKSKTSGGYIWKYNKHK